MIAVVYSGSKNACWKIQQEGTTVTETHTASINPCFNDTKHILQLLSKNITLIHHAESIRKIYVFAAGASSKEKQKELAATFQQFFVNAKIKVKDDLYGAALAACHSETGVVGILGSGSNCAYYNGKKPQKNNYGLGYILADEGSANYFGKMLLKNFLEEKLPEDLRVKAEAQYHLDRAVILERVYRKPQVQTYLGSFLDFYLENSNHKFIQQLINKGFETYFKLYIIPTLEAHPNEEVHFVGSVAGAFQEQLREVANRHDINIMSITKEPIHNILNYYTNS